MKPVQPFIRPSRAQTMLRDFDRLRKAIRSEGTEAIQDAWDKCERWTSCIDPNAGER